MSNRPHPRRARVNRDNPRAWATDMRSGFVGNLVNAQWQHDWRGQRLTNLKLLVYGDQLDKPQRQLGTIVLQPDLLPIQNARPGNSIAAEQVIAVTEDYDAVVGDIVTAYEELTVTLQTAEEVNGQSITVNNGGTDIVTVATTDSQTISGELTYELDADESLTVISNGLNWDIWP